MGIHGKSWILSLSRSEKGEFAIASSAWNREVAGVTGNFSGQVFSNFTNPQDQPYTARFVCPGHFRNAVSRTLPDGRPVHAIRSGSNQTFNNRPLFVLLRLMGGGWNPVELSASKGSSMPKQKTHKGMKRRFSVTASGKAKHRSAYRGHLLSHKNAKRKRGLRQDGVVDGVEARKIVDALRPSL
jgi:large subunit ribosomal protein L35